MRNIGVKDHLIPYKLVTEQSWNFHIALNKRQCEASHFLSATYGNVHIYVRPSVYKLTFLELTYHGGHNTFHVWYLYLVLGYGMICVLSGKVNDSGGDRTRTWDCTLCLTFVSPCSCFILLWVFGLVCG